MTARQRNSKASHPVYADTRYRKARAELRTYDLTCHAHGCGRPINTDLPRYHPWSWSADHIIPKSALNPDDYRLWHISNLQAMHLRCNQRKQGVAPRPTPITTYINDEW